MEDDPLGARQRDEGRSIAHPNEPEDRRDQNARSDDASSTRVVLLLLSRISLVPRIKPVPPVRRLGHRRCCRSRHQAEGSDLLARQFSSGDVRRARAADPTSLGDAGPGSTYGRRPPGMATNQLPEEQTVGGHRRADAISRTATSSRPRSAFAATSRLASQAVETAQFGPGRCVSKPDGSCRSKCARRVGGPRHHEWVGDHL